MSPNIRLICTALLVSILTTPTQAHDIYALLKNKRGASCCDGSDCRPAQYRIQSSGVQMRVNGEWFNIDPDLIEFRGLDGRGLPELPQPRSPRQRR